MEDKMIAIILGNRLNDDGTISKIQEERLIMAKEIEEKFHPDYFILTGGIANKKAKISEADAMYNYLVNNGFNKDKLIKEEDSLTTVENAKNSIHIAKRLNAKYIMVCTSGYHFADPKYQTMESFVSIAAKYNLILLTYTR